MPAMLKAVGMHTPTRRLKSGIWLTRAYIYTRIVTAAKAAAISQEQMDVVPFKLSSDCLDAGH